MRNDIKRYLLLIVGLVAGFFVLHVGIDRLVQQQQLDNLRAIAGQVQFRGSEIKLLEDTEHVLITSLGDENADRQSYVEDLFKQANAGKTVQGSMNFDGEKRIVVARRTEEGNFLAVWQKEVTAANTAPQLWLIFQLSYAGIALLILARFYWRTRYWQGHLAKVSENLSEIRRGEPVNATIYTPGSPFMALGTEISELADDVTHLREKLELRQASFDRLIGHLPQGVMLIDSERQVILSNAAMNEFVGHEINPDRHNYLDDVKTYALARMIEHTFRNQRTHHRELNLITAQKAVDASVIALTGADQLQVLVILYDVTYLRQVEQMQLDFVGNVSHELKTPVTAIQGFAETLLDGAKNDPEALDKFLKIIRSESHRLTQLITDILTLSQSDSGPAELTMVTFGELIDSALQNLAEPIKEKKLTIKREFPEDFAFATVAPKLSQICRNLLNNAVFYNREGGKVLIGAKQTERDIELTFADTGLGIAEDDKERIFERFYRVDKARSRHNGGTGLGLAIVSEMVQELGGEITVESQVGVGTRFVVSLPRTDLPSFYN